AVLQAPRNRVVVVAVDRRDGPLLDQRADLVRARRIADEIPAAVDRIDVQALDLAQAGPQCGEVAVDVGDDRNPLHALILSIDEHQLNRYSSMSMPRTGIPSVAGRFYLRSL